jgi:hypothetical protein
MSMNNNKYVESISEPATFSFPTILEGRGAVITIDFEEGHYDILINRAFVARMRFDEDRYEWCVAEGDLTDADLVNEIGERIEKVFNSAYKKSA